MATEQDIYNDIADAQTENNTQAAKIAEAMSLLNTKAAGGGGGDDSWKWTFVEELEVPQDVVEYRQTNRYADYKFDELRIECIWQGTSANTGETAANVEMYFGNVRLNQASVNWASRVSGTLSSYFTASAAFTTGVNTGSQHVVNASQNAFSSSATNVGGKKASGFVAWCSSGHYIGAGTKFYVYGRKVR